MDRETTPAPQLGVQPPTPVRQATSWLQVVLVEYVSQMVSGQGAIQIVQVSVQLLYVLRHCAYRNSDKV